MKFPSPVKFLRSLRKFFQRPELVPKSVEIRRDEICEKCEHNQHGQCQQCTCYIPVKTKFATEFCPIHKWGEYFNTIKNGL